MRKADNLSPSGAVVMKSGNLNFVEPSGPVQACNGTAFTKYTKIFKKLTCVIIPNNRGNITEMSNILQKLFAGSSCFVRQDGYGNVYC